MHDHLTREQIAALLDEPEAVPGGAAHLDACTRCGAEFEGMSRMRMALSALPDMAAPAGQWERIQARLAVGSLASPASSESSDAQGEPGVVPVKRAGGPLRRLQSALSTPLAAAAVLALFMGGLAVGRMLAPGGDAAADAPTRTAEGAHAADGVGGNPFSTLAGEAGGVTPEELAAYPEYFQTVSDLQRLREAGPRGAGVREDPALAAERLTRLDALIDASREALRSAPADPALNDFLFDVSDERASLAGQLNQTLRQASMEY